MGALLKLKQFFFADPKEIDPGYDSAKEIIDFMKSEVPKSTIEFPYEFASIVSTILANEEKEKAKLGL